MLLRDENGRFIKGNEGFWLGKKRPEVKKWLSSHQFNKGNTPWNKGIKSWVKPWLDKKRPEMLEEKNPDWKGDNVKYGALHDWIRSRKGSPLLCSKCNKSIHNSRSYHWHNTDGLYKRNLEDWIRLCTSCHKLEHGNNK